MTGVRLRGVVSARRKRGEEAKCFFPSSISRDGLSGSPRSGTGRAWTGRRLAANAGQGMFLGLLLGDGLELEPFRIGLTLALDLDDDRVPAGEGAPEDLLAERVLDHVLDGPAQRASTVVGVVALGDQVVFGVVGEDELQSAV